MAKLEFRFKVEMHTSMLRYLPVQSMLSYGLSRVSLSRAFSSTVPSSAVCKVGVEKSSCQGQVRPRWRQHILADLP